MAKNTVICWFRNDLRLADNPALYEAAKAGDVLPIYILDDTYAAHHAAGAASRVWLHHSLEALNVSLNGKFSIYRGDPLSILPQLIASYNVSDIFWNRCYEPSSIQRDKDIKLLLQKQTNVQTFNGSLLWEPWEVLKSDGTAYKVFTPFYRNGCLNAKPPRSPLPIPSALSLIRDDKHSISLSELELLPSRPWGNEMMKFWKAGEEGAQAALTHFLHKGIEHYKEGRNFPAKNYVSRLSPHLHFGEISPNQLWHSALLKGDNSNVDHFCSELGWREFSYSLLHHYPHLPEKNLRESFDRFPWRDDDEGALSRWQKGQTGIPIVDAGMRELWQTGYMHNRVRMIVSSFLVKNLLLDWRHGERWFWDCLVDADLANNSASWQWVAGCGADAAPYFRIFNPVTQGKKFDPDGTYTRRYVPELSGLPDLYLFNPWDAPEKILSEANITLGKTYPHPIVDIKSSRERALKAFQSIRSGD